ncbi:MULTISPECIES: FlgD immunoglobulin-like domain containing protein [unclassified Marinobacter]|jgi:hypothetical protein|uniref:FlgD immunoglobulin-like domain containing protein n=1 Tax=unclassified Marinobacter TaxID=83889 RepID=UPI00200EDE2D|nr:MULTISPECIES: FlgD immunoglobulin-like domain containing protein [unclassified Marinobacter]MCL1478990.1 hypothetical protein [Marinobacter sp.]MCL1484408.1 hypothetical protein [Marinobacter sp.]UQG57953.1 hypothetical protein MIH16_10105 [Marinobacter sp. M4C]UQG66758.1 hypothetical protein MIH17_10110 [Marinobacter sp. M2C]UQG71038.1 hypothetical protein MIH19_10105 [Marinobacter sp. M1C]
MIFSRITQRLLIIALCAAVPGLVLPAPLEALPAASQSFNPSAGDVKTIRFSLEQPGKVQLTLYSGDGNAVRVLETIVAKAGNHALRWDGKDESGVVVPDEAYTPVFQCVCGGELITVDSRGTSGGYPVAVSNVQIDPSGAVSYQLAKPSRVLVRVGIKGGALVRSIATWVPKTEGRQRQPWDGLDHAGQNLLSHPKLTLLVRAIALPDHTIQTVGNNNVSYRTYREQNEWALPTADFSQVKLERNGERIARESQIPISLLRNPETQLSFETNETQNGIAVVRGPVTFRVDMSPSNKWVMQQSLYEVAFFVDYQFVSEEETGYTPLSWRWSADVDPGFHTMTVNISGLWGQVGVETVQFLVKE